MWPWNVCRHGAPMGHHHPISFTAKQLWKKERRQLFVLVSTVLCFWGLTLQELRRSATTTFFSSQSIYMHTSSLDSLYRKSWWVGPPKKKASHSRGWRGSERAEWSQRSNKPRSPCTMSVTRMRREKKEEFACLPPSMCVARAPQKEKRPRTVAHERPALVNWGGHSTSVCTWVVIAALSWCGYRKCEAVVFRGKPQDLASAAPPTANWWHTCTTCYQHSDSHR